MPQPQGTHQTAHDHREPSECIGAPGDQPRSGWDHVEWWRTPALSYTKGLSDGVAIGRREAYAEIWQVFRDSFAAQGQDFDAAWADTLRAIDAIDRRRAWDRAAPMPRRGDYAGRRKAA